MSSNIRPEVAKSLADRLNVPITRSLKKYLGIPIMQGRVNNSTFNEATLSLKKQLSKAKNGGNSAEIKALLEAENAQSIAAKDEKKNAKAKKRADKKKRESSKLTKRLLKKLQRRLSSMKLTQFSTVQLTRI